jgi:O-antigen/teichoic acid export membrane protein
LYTSQLKKKAASAVFWNLSGTLMKQGVTFIISIFLARLLSPADFGLVGMATVFVALTQSFADFGMTSGLIQKKDPSEVQYSTVFYINIGISFLLMFLMIFASDFIGNYYGNEEVARIARFVSYSFIIDALNGVQTAQLTKALANKIKTLAAVYSAAGSGVLGIILAYKGFGVWSLVYSAVFGSVINTFIIWRSTTWRPKALFSFTEVKPLLKFGSKMFFSSLLDTAYTKFDVLIIGRLFSSSTLGYYYRAASFNQLVTRYTSGSLQGVFFPVISHLQDDRHTQQKVISKSLHIMSFFTFMLIGLLYLDSMELIVILFTDKWLVSVDYFKLMVFYAYAYPVSVILVSVISGNGHSDIFLKLEIWKKVTGLLAMAVGFYFGIMGFLVGMIIASALAVLLNMWYVKKIIAWPVKTQIKIVFQYSVYCLVAVLIVLFTKGFLPNSLWISLIVGSISYILIYLGFNKIVVSEGYLLGEKYFLEFIKMRIKKNDTCN